jgi:hypothetical protein
MTDVNLLKLVFPEHASRIHQMRKTHSGFDVLCQDFDLLSDELGKHSADSSSACQFPTNPITESLDGLVEEIAEQLSVVVHSRVVPKAISEVIPVFIQLRKKD